MTEAEKEVEATTEKINIDANLEYGYGSSKVVGEILRLTNAALLKVIQERNEAIEERDQWKETANKHQKN